VQQNVVDAFDSILNGINERAFVAERDFLKQILSLEKPGVEFEAFVSYLGSPPTNLQSTHRILSDGGVINLLRRKFENVENFWKYSSSWMVRRSLSASTFDAQYRFFLDSSWFGNIIFDEGNPRDTPFIANLTTDFSPLLFHTHAKQMWKLAPPSIVISVLGNMIQDDKCQDFVKQFFRVDLSGYLNSQAALDEDRVPWIFCEGHGGVAGLIGEFLGSSSRVSAGESTPVRTRVLAFSRQLRFKLLCRSSGFRMQPLCAQLNLFVIRATPGKFVSRIFGSFGMILIVQVHL
jgi:hypothetical protein